MSNTIYIETNTPQFANDLAEEVRLFLPDAEIVSDASSCCDIHISVFADFGDVWNVQSKATGKICGEYKFSYPAQVGDEIVQKRHRKRCEKVAVFRLLRSIYPDAFVAWGSLTGIRPTKLLRDLDEESGIEKAKEQMLNLFDVEDRKYGLTNEILRIQQPFISDVKANDIDIYIDIPYCKTKCLYCSFPSDVRTKKTNMRPYIDALKDDIKRGSELVKRFGYNVRAAYMGGGTPTVLTEDELSEVLDFAYDCYGTLGREFTVEAGRPDTITKRKLEILKEHGTNRISINPQTMNDATLRLIGRSHTAQELYDCYYMARDIGFDINTDIITCLPGEGIQELEHTLRCIQEMQPENLTVHTLALKRSSKLKEIIGDEEIQSIMPTAALADTMVERGREVAHRMGMNAYYMYRQKYMQGNLENVGYAKPGKECIYNIDMMEETVSIMAHGAGSMSKRIFPGHTLRVERIPNPKDIATYIGKLDKVYEEKERLFVPGDSF